MATPTDVLRIAAGEIGYTRWDDPQTGTKFSRWYADLTNDPGMNYNGVPYCAMFVSWCFAQAGQEMPGMPTGSCRDIRNANAGTSREVSKYDAQPGDVILFDWDPKKGNGADHVGIVELNKGSYVQTIEGNTSSGSSGSQSNGGGVWRRTRAYSTVYAIYRPVYESEDEVTEQDKQDIASKVWDMVLNGVKARDRLIGIDNAANGANNKLADRSDPTGRDMNLTDHEHIKWIAKSQQDMIDILDATNESLKDIAAKVDALGVLLSKN